MKNEPTLEEFVQRETDSHNRKLSQTQNYISKLTARLVLAKGSSSTRLSALIKLHSDHLAELLKEDPSQKAANLMAAHNAYKQSLVAKKNELQQRIQAINMNKPKNKPA